MGLNINVFLLISLFTIIFSVYIGIYILIFSYFSKASLSFSIFSFNIAAALSYFLILIISSHKMIHFSAYLLNVFILFVPVSLFNFINDFFENKLYKLKSYVKYLYYILPIIIIFFLQIRKSVDVKYGSFGYVISYSELMYIGIFYYTTLYILIASIIAIELRNNIKANRSIRMHIYFFIGVLIYLSGSVIYGILNAVNMVEDIPINSILIIIMYLFISISILILKNNFDIITQGLVFESTEDCIIIFDSYRRIIKVNQCMFQKFFKNEIKLNKKVIDTDLIKKTLIERAVDNIDVENGMKLFKGF